jgi:hypothetical protein
MDPAVTRMETQLRAWRRTIDGLAAAVHGLGKEGEFDALVYIDELKALHATAQFELDGFKAASGAERTRRMVRLKGAWDDLDEAVANLDP